MEGTPTHKKAKESSFLAHSRPAWCLPGTLAHLVEGCILFLEKKR